MQINWIVFFFHLKSTQNDANLTLKFAESLARARLSQNKSKSLVNSFNRTLNNSESKTLFQVSMSLYENEYVQEAMQKLFQSRTFKWSIIVDKIEMFGIMMLEVLVIGMRYYPLMGIMDKNRVSVVCLLLAAVYMWADTLYNVAITGLCEGLKLNVSFDLLRDIRRVFGAGFLLDAREHLKLNQRFDKVFRTNISAHSSSTANTNEIPIDARLLFSTSRIVYSIVKSLPHFFCLSYVTIRLTAALIETICAKLVSFGLISDNNGEFNAFFLFCFIFEWLFSVK